MPWRPVGCSWRCWSCDDEQRFTLLVDRTSDEAVLLEEEDAVESVEPHEEPLPANQGLVLARGNNSWRPRIRGILLFTIWSWLSVCSLEHQSSRIINARVDPAINKERRRCFRRKTNYEGTSHVPSPTLQEKSLQTSLQTVGILFRELLLER